MYNHPPSKAVRLSDYEQIPFPEILNEMKQVEYAYFVITLMKHEILCLPVRVMPVS